MSRTIRILLLFYLCRRVFCSTDDGHHNAKQKKSTTNTSDFFELVTGDEPFVDKTGFIELYLGKSGLINRFIRPRSWGKSIALDMVRRFVAIELDQDGRPLPDTERVNRKLFVGGPVRLDENRTALLQPLQIAKNGDLIANIQGRFPVVSLHFKQVPTATNYKQFEDGLRALLADAFRLHGYLADKNPIAESEREEFDRYRTGETANRTQLVAGLTFLCKLLHRQFNRKPHIFVDDYDDPLNRLFIELLNKRRTVKQQYKQNTEKQIYYDVGMSDDLDNATELVRDLLETELKTNQHFQQAFVTGTFDVQLAELSEGFPENRSYDLLNKEFFELFAFTETDMDHMLSRITSFQPDRKRIRTWFGYNITGCIMYNPWSIRHWLAEDYTLRDYWSRSGSTPLADQVLLANAMQSNIQNLAENSSPVLIGVRRKVEYFNVNRDATALVAAGFVSVLSNSYSAQTHLVPANREALDLIRTKVIQWTCRKLNATEGDFESITRQLFRFDVGEFNSTLRRIVRKVSTKKILPWNAKILYDSIMRSIKYSFGTQFVSTSYKKGSFDVISIVGKVDISNRAFLLYYKVIEDPDEFPGELVNRTRTDYLADMTIDSRYKNIDRLLRINLAFCSNRFDLKHELVRYNR